jgi:predicted RecB family endonuclease
MNNFVFSQDPLLYTSLMARQNPQNEAELRQQLNDAIIQYQTMNQPPQPQSQPQVEKDYLGEVDKMVSELDEDIVLVLSADAEYLKLQDDLQKMIQEEMMRSIRWKINSNPKAISKMDRLKELIIAAKKNKSDEDRRIMADINDYVKNYSDLTFEEYKQLKYGK